MPTTRTVAGQTCLENSPEKTEIMRVFVSRPARCLLLEEIADEIHADTETVESRLAALQADGLFFDCQNVFGVLYQPEESRLHPDILGARLSTQWWGKRILTGDELTSTIDIAKALPSDETLHGTVILANEQTRGRGRHGSHWVSRKGRDILLTFVAVYGEWIPSPSLISLFAGISVMRVLDTAYHLPAMLKWPNDLYIKQRKVGGVMVERDDSRRCFLISLGLNVHSRYSDWPDECRETATSLSMEKGSDWQRDLLVSQCGNTWEFLWDLMMQDKGESIRHYWKKYSGTINKTVRLQLHNQELIGIVKDLTPEGLLILEDHSGSLFELVPEHVHHLRIVEED